MFIQIIQGKCTRQDELRALADTWREEMAPTAEGWLGGTYGFTDDDQFVGDHPVRVARSGDAELRTPRAG